MIEDFTDLVISDIGAPPANCGPLVVAMSGGVDSSTIAALLSHIGYNVIGITLNLYSGNAESSCGTKTCCGSRDIRDAKAVSAKFGFSHYILDYTESFHNDVIRKFASSYIAGETPVPCIDCNRTVKFTKLLDLSKSLNADALITGHYVRRKIINGVPSMLEASDGTKDQSYFLGFTTREQLEFLRFPLGNFYKSEIRGLAQELGVEIYDKPDSQDICFVGGGDYRDFIAKFYPKKVGPILDCDGNKVGEHDGIHNFTVGQRRGIPSAAYHGQPLYVVKINADDNSVVVGARDLLMSSKLVVSDLSWMLPVVSGDNVEVKLRSAQEPMRASVLSVDSHMTTLELFDPYFAVTPGQACVIYKKTVVMGGGTIKYSL